MQAIRLFVLWGLLFGLLVAPAAALDTVFVVRHAQKNPSPGWKSVDIFRPVSPKGARCASQLSELLKHRGIAAVYTSEVTRTLATGAAVTANRDNVRVIGDNATVKPTPEWVEAIRQRHLEDQAILIVGHSDTVDDVVLAFRPDVKECMGPYGLMTPAIPEDQYGDVWRLDLNADSKNCTGFNRMRLRPMAEYDCTTP